MAIVTRIRSAFNLNRQDALAGMRIATIGLLPLFIGSLAGQPVLGLMGYLGGLYACMADVGGAYQARALSMGLATMFLAVVGFLATLAGGAIWLAVPLMFLCAFLGSMMSVYGNIGSKVSFVVICAFLIILSMPAGLVVAGERFGVLLIGGGWAMLLSLWLWPLRPYRPVRVAVANYYRMLSTFIERLCASTSYNHNTFSVAVSEMDGERSRVVTAQENARTIFVQVRSAQHGADPIDQHLLQVALNADSLFDITLALVSGIRNTAEHPYVARMPAFLRQIGSELSTALAECVLAIERGTGEVDLNKLDMLKGKLDAYDADLSSAIPASEADYQARVSTRYLLRRLKAMIGTMHLIVDAVRQLNSDEREEPTGISFRPAANVNLQAAIETFNDNLTLRSIVFRHALRVGIATALAVALYMLLQLPHGFWIPLTVLIILKPDFGATLQRAFERMGGTVLGGIVGGVLAAIIHNLPIQYTLVWLLGCVAFAYRQRNYTVFAFFLTPFVVLLVDLSHPGDWQVSLLRIFNTVIGGVLALVAGFVVWPRWTREQLPEQLAKSIATNRRFFSGVLAAYLGQQYEMGTLRTLSREARLENANTAATFQRVLSEPKAMQRNVKHLYALLSYNLQLYDSITILAAHLSTLKKHHTLSGLEQFAAQAENVLQRLEEIVCSGYHPISTDQFEESVQEVEASLQQLRETRLAELSAGLIETPNREAMTKFSPMNIELERLAHEVVSMAHIQE
jgi:uncharacterized membrane protein YccC